MLGQSTELSPKFKGCIYKDAAFIHKWVPIVYSKGINALGKFWSVCFIFLYSGVAIGVARWAECHPWQRKICQKGGKIRKKEEKSGRKGKNREGYFTLPLLTDRTGYATVLVWCFWSTIKEYHRQDELPVAN